VRDERVYLRTLRGLEPVHVLLKRLDDEFLDPLELRADSTLGIPGLLQAVRAGNVVVANAPGSAFLESPALLGFLPALSEKLLGEELLNALILIRQHPFELRHSPNRRWGGTGCLPWGRNGPRGTALRRETSVRRAPPVG
jgi:uncharacterized circularly permuted ATP-grasp superfamily protein